MPISPRLAPEPDENNSCYATNTRQTIVCNHSFVPVSGRSMTLREGGFSSSVEGISIFATGSLLKMIPELRAKRTVSSSFRSGKKSCHFLIHFVFNRELLVIIKVRMLAERSSETTSQVSFDILYSTEATPRS